MKPISVVAQFLWLVRSQPVQVLAGYLALVEDKTHDREEVSTNTIAAGVGGGEAGRRTVRHLSRSRPVGQ